MCEFCKNLSYEKDEYKELASITNNMGVLGEMTTSIGVWANNDGTFTMQTMLGGIMSDAEEAEAKISFCPMCGRELCHSDRSE